MLYITGAGAPVWTAVNGLEKGNNGVTDVPIDDPLHGVPGDRLLQHGTQVGEKHIVGYGLPWGEVFPGESVALWVLVQLAVVSSQNLQRGVANAFLEPGELLLSALPLLKIS